MAPVLVLTVLDATFPVVSGRVLIFTCDPANTFLYHFLLTPSLQSGFLLKKNHSSLWFSFSSTLLIISADAEGRLAFSSIFFTILPLCLCSVILSAFSFVCDVNNYQRYYY